jgi:hypothetical protein
MRKTLPVVFACLAACGGDTTTPLNPAGGDVGAAIGVDQPQTGARPAIIPVGGGVSAITSPSDIPPGTTLTFAETTTPRFAVVTTQYAAFGVTFSPSHFVQSPLGGSLPPGIDRSHLANFFAAGVSCPGPRSIFFDPIVSAAGFNIANNTPDQLLLTAKRNGVALGSATFNTDDVKPHFAGLAAAGGIDELVLEIIPEPTRGSNRCGMIDNLTFGTDNTPPVIHLNVAPSELWPPNHSMRLVADDVSATDDFDPSPTIVVTVTSNQPQDGGEADWEIVDNGDGTFDVSVRAERGGSGDRVYTITVEATDSAGNRATASATVGVPHDKGK